MPNSDRDSLGFRLTDQERDPENTGPGNMHFHAADGTGKASCIEVVSIFPARRYGEEGNSRRDIQMIEIHVTKAREWKP